LLLGCTTLHMSMTSIQSLDYVVLVCRDLGATRTFYKSVLGFTITYERDDWVKFQVGSVSIALRPQSDLFADRHVIGSAVQLAFEVPYSDVDSCCTELEQQGVNIVQRPTDQTWGHRTLFFNDPEGNIVEIYAEIDERQINNG